MSTPSDRLDRRQFLHGTLAGAAPLQMPASIDLFADPQLKDRFERWWGTASMPAVAPR